MSKVLFVIRNYLFIPALRLYGARYCAGMALGNTPVWRVRQRRCIVRSYAGTSFGNTTTVIPGEAMVRRRPTKKAALCSAAFLHSFYAIIKLLF